MRSKLVQWKIVLFLGLTILLSLWPYVQIISTGTVEGAAVLALMWAPGLAALVTQLVTARTVAGLGWRLAAPRWLVTSLLLPLGACVVVYGLAWGVGLAPFTASGLRESFAAATGMTLALPLVILLVVTLGLVMGLLTALGEELGWRGLLLPALASHYSFTTAALVSGVIWAIYHFPVMLFADYGSGAPLGYVLPMFTVSVMAVAVIMGWLRLKTGSVWTAALMHASHNLFVQQVFDPMTLDFGLAPYVTTEFGVGLAIVYTLIAVYFWRRRGEVAQAGV